MTLLPLIRRLENISFESAARAFSSDPGFIAVRESARYSFVASRPKHTLKFTGGFVTIDGHTVIDSPSKALAKFFDLPLEWASDPYLPFSSGGIGYITFEGARALRGNTPASGFSRFPQCFMGIYPSVCVFDRVEGTAFVVANGSTINDAERSAGELVERLNSVIANPYVLSLRAKAKQSPAWDCHVALRAPRNDMLDDARLHLRSEILKRVHLAEHSVSEAPKFSAIEYFLHAPAKVQTCAIFGFDGAYAVVSSEELILTTDNNGSMRAKRLIDLIPSPKFVGEPFAEALSFHSRHDGEHHTFFGGTFGMFDSAGLKFHAINETVNFADGAMRVIRGRDVF